MTVSGVSQGGLFDYRLFWGTRVFVVPLRSRFVIPHPSGDQAPSGWGTRWLVMGGRRAGTRDEVGFKRRRFEMSEMHETSSWIDRWFPLLLIVFGLIFTTVLVSFKPTI